MQKNIQKYMCRKIYTKTLRIQNLWGILKLGASKTFGGSLANAKNLTHPNLWRMLKTWCMAKYWRLQGCWRTEKTRRPPMLAQQEKYADPLKNCLTV
jgi:hypothetical protein